MQEQPTPPDSPSIEVTRRRLYRAGAAKLVLGAYVLDAAVMLALAGAGATSFVAGFAWFGIGAVVYSLFATIFKAGAGENSRDPNLTRAQLACHVAGGLAFVQFFPRLAVLVVAALIVICGWGSSRLRPRDAVVTSFAAFAAIAAALLPIAGQAWLPRGGIGVAAVTVLFFGTLLARFVLLGQYAAAVGVQLAARRAQTLDLSRTVASYEAALADARVSARVDVERRIAGLAEAAAAGKERLRLMEERLRRLAHELRSPMTGVLGMHAMLAETDLTEEQRGYLALARRSAEAVLPIVDRAVVPPPPGPVPANLDTDDVEMRDVFDDCLVDHGPAALERRILLGLDVSPSVPPVVRMDARRLRRLLSHLVGDAVAGSSRGSLALSASWSAETEDRGTLTLDLSGIQGGGTAVDRSAADLVRRCADELGGGFERIDADDGTGRIRIRLPAGVPADSDAFAAKGTGLLRAETIH